MSVNTLVQFDKQRTEVPDLLELPSELQLTTAGISRVNPLSIPDQITPIQTDHHKPATPSPRR